MNREQIEQLLPHRAPMLLLDTVQREGDVAVGTYTIPHDAFFVQGHFPGNPVVPGVILCEIMGQSACVLIEQAGGSFTPYFTGMDKVKFRKKVLPGDTITVKSRVTGQKGPFYFVECQGFVDEQLAVQGQLSFAVVAGE